MHNPAASTGHLPEPDSSGDRRRALLLGAVIALADSGDGSVGLLALVTDGASAEQVSLLEDDIHILITNGQLASHRASTRALKLSPTTTGRELWATYGNADLGDDAFSAATGSSEPTASTLAPSRTRDRNNNTR